MRLLRGLAIILAAIAFVMAGAADPEASRFCPSCGLDAAKPVYRGATRVEGRYRCQQCGAGLWVRDDGALAEDPL